MRNLEDFIQVGRERFAAIGPEAAAVFDALIVDYRQVLDADRAALAFADVERARTRAEVDHHEIEKAAGAAHWSKGLAPVQLKEFLHRQEVDYIEQVIETAGGDKEKAAEMLGISMATLYRKLASPSSEVEAEVVQRQAM